MGSVANFDFLKEKKWGKSFWKKFRNWKSLLQKKNSKQKLCCAWYEEFEKEMLLSKKKKDFCPSQKSEKNWTKKILCASVFFCMTVKDISAPLRKNGLKKTHYQVFDFFAHP